MVTLRPGDRLGRYRIESRLGAGGMGVVYVARDEPLDRQVALKVLAPELAADAGFRSRFAGEARAAAAVEHPHLLPIFETGEADGILFLAMRYVPGFDLGTLLARDGALPLARALELVGQVGEALDAAHAAGLVHRDVKPANVLVGPGDHAYLADFGLARAAAASGGLTRPGQVAAGSAEYLAPELLDGRVADARSDLYALACLAFACLTGRPPFRRPDDVATLYAHAHEPPPALTSLRAELPPALDAVLARGLAKDPAERYPSASTFAAALWAGAEGSGTDKADHPRQREQRGSLRLRVSLGMGAIAVIGGAAGLWWNAGGFRFGEAAGAVDTTRDGRIAYVLDVGDGVSSRLTLVNSDGTDGTEIHLEGLTFLGGGLSWTPDGQWLALDADGGIWRVRPDGTDLERITSGNSPAWAPDGERLAFNRTDPSHQNCFACRQLVIIREADGTEQVIGSGFKPSWSPDGTLIALAAGSSTAAGFPLGFMHSDGSNRREAFSELLVEHTSAPAWSPDGSSLVFAARESFEDASSNLYKTDRDGITLRRLTDHPGYDLNPSWSSASDRIVVRRLDADGSDGLAIIWLGNGHVERLLSVDGPGRVIGVGWGPPASGGLLAGEVRQGPPDPTSAATWVPDPPPGNDLVTLAATTRIGYIASASADIDSAAYAIRPDRTGLTRLLFDTGACCGGFDFSPDGRRVALAVLREVDGPASYELHVVDLDGPGRVPVRDVAASGAAWSPDGRSLAFVTFEGDPTGRFDTGLRGSLVVADVESGETRTVVEARDFGIASNAEPTWSPDGVRIAFLRFDRSGSASVWSVASDGTDLRLVAPLPDLQPLSIAWSPDGTTFIVSSEGEDGSIHALTADGRSLARLTAGTLDASAAWSPDGAFIAFQSQRGGTAEIYVMRPDGTEQTRITDPADGVDALQPTWGYQPDG